MNKNQIYLEIKNIGLKNLSSSHGIHNIIQTQLNQNNYSFFGIPWSTIISLYNSISENKDNGICFSALDWKSNALTNILPEPLALLCDEYLDDRLSVKIDDKFITQPIKWLFSKFPGYNEDWFIGIVKKDSIYEFTYPNDIKIMHRYRPKVPQILFYISKSSDINRLLNRKNLVTLHVNNDFWKRMVNNTMKQTYSYSMSVPLINLSSNNIHLIIDAFFDKYTAHYIRIRIANGYEDHVQYI